MVELEALQNNLKQFENYGASIVALCPQRQKFNAAVVKKLGLGFPVVQDRGNIVATAFGLTLETPPDVIEAEKFLGLDLPAHNGIDNWDLPIPARFAIDCSGKACFAALHVDHRMRSDPSHCLDSLKELTQP